MNLLPTNSSDSYINESANQLVNGNGHYNHYIFWIFLSFEAAGIICGNAMLCWLFVTRKNLRSKQNFLIISLSFSDLLVGLSIAPCEYCRWSRNGTNLTCPLFCGSIISFNMAASVINLTVIASDRYISLEKAFTYNQIVSKRRVIATILFGWIFAIFLSVLPLAWGLAPSIKDKTKELINIIYASLLFMLTMFAGIMLFISYRHIVKTVWMKMRKLHIGNNKRSSSTAGIWACIVSTTIFFFSWVVYCCIEILLQCRIRVPDAIMDAGYFILLISPCMDPALYGYYRKDFRRCLPQWINLKRRYGSAKKSTTSNDFCTYESSIARKQGAWFPPTFEPGSDMTSPSNRIITGGRKQAAWVTPPLQTLEADLLMEYVLE